MGFSACSNNLSYNDGPLYTGTLPDGCISGAQPGNNEVDPRASPSRKHHPQCRRLPPAHHQRPLSLDHAPCGTPPGCGAMSLRPHQRTPRCLSQRGCHANVSAGVRGCEVPAYLRHRFPHRHHGKVLRGWLQGHRIRLAEHDGWLTASRQSTTGWLQSHRIRLADHGGWLTAPLSHRTCGLSGARYLPAPRCRHAPIIIASVVIYVSCGKASMVSEDITTK